MAPRNANLRALLLVTLFTFLLFQETAGDNFWKYYCSCKSNSSRQLPTNKYGSLTNCMERKFSSRCPQLETPRMKVDDDCAGPDMGVAVAAGGGNQGKGKGNGTETGAAP